MKKRSYIIGLVIFATVFLATWLASHILPAGHTDTKPTPIYSNAMNTFEIERLTLLSKRSASNRTLSNLSPGVPPGIQFVARNDLIDNSRNAWRTPIEFYGQVLDETTNPVAGVQINFDCNDLSLNGTSFYQTTSDSNGMFAIKDINGKLLTVRVTKNGYYTYQPLVKIFFYAGENENFTPDANAPVIFWLRKKGQGEPLIHIAGIGLHSLRDYLLDIGGKPTELSLYDGKLTSADACDLRVEFKAGPPLDNLPSRITWNCQVTVPDGGLVETDDPFPFLAPSDGYKESDHWSLSETNWTDEIRKQYYLRLRGGHFGRLTIRILGTTRPFFRMESFVNPSGSRNLEPAQ